MEQQVTTTVRNFVLRNFVFLTESAVFPDGDSLIESGLIDSTGILELVSFLESEFHIAVEDQEIIPENLASITAISRFVEAKGVRRIAEAGVI